MDFVTLRSRVLNISPGLQRIIASSGNLSLFEYQLQSLGAPPAISEDRQEELFGVLRKKIGQIDPGSAEEVVAELRRHYTVSTGDHHGPIAHPFSLTGQWSRLAVLGEHLAPVTLTLSCSSISLNNSSFPRGQFFHTRSGEEERLSFFSLRERHCPVYGLRGYTKEELAVFRSAHVLNQEITREKGEQLKTIIDSIYAAPEVLSLLTYAEQISHTNYRLWKKIAGQEKAKCFFLDQESVVVELLLAYHLGQGTLLDQLLTDSGWYQAFEQFFEGCIGAFSRREQKGTFLFWALKNGERKSLILQGNKLVSADGGYMVELSSKSLHDGLVGGELIPSMALTFIVLSFYYGLRCGGGFSQVSYLPDMQRRYGQMLKAMGASVAAIEVAESVATGYLAADFACLQIATNKGRSGATTFDFLLYQTPQTAEQLTTLLHSCTLGEAVDQLMPEFYKILFHENPGVAAPATFSPILYA